MTTNTPDNPVGTSACASGAGKWSAVRGLFVRHAEAFVGATRYEEASAIADKAAREIDDLYAAPVSLPDEVREAVAELRKARDRYMTPGVASSGVQISATAADAIIQAITGEKP